MVYFFAFTFCFCQISNGFAFTECSSSSSPLSAMSRACRLMRLRWISLDLLGRPRFTKAGLSDCLPVGFRWKSALCPHNILVVARADFTVLWEGGGAIWRSARHLMLQILLAGGQEPLRGKGRTRKAKAQLKKGEKCKVKENFGKYLLRRSKPTTLRIFFVGQKSETESNFELHEVDNDGLLYQTACKIDHNWCIRCVIFARLAGSLIRTGRPCKDQSESCQINK